MSIKLTNGAVVSRFYGDGTGELLAAFQYFSDAEHWAQIKVDEDHHAGMDTHLIATCRCAGTSRQFTHKKPPS